MTETSGPQFYVIHVLLVSEHSQQKFNHFMRLWVSTKGKDGVESCFHVIVFVVDDFLDQVRYFQSTVTNAFENDCFSLNCFGSGVFLHVELKQIGLWILFVRFEIC